LLKIDNNLLNTNSLKKGSKMEFSKLYRIMEADVNPAMGAKPSDDSGLKLAGYGANNTGSVKPGSDESLNPRSFGKEEVRKALLNIERINKDAKGMYTPLFTHLRKNPEAMQLFGELINTLAGATTSVGGRMAKPLNM
jgi:hypothetical protein